MTQSRHSRDKKDRSVKGLIIGFGGEGDEMKAYVDQSRYLWGVPVGSCPQCRCLQRNQEGEERAICTDVFSHEIPEAGKSTVVTRHIDVSNPSQLAERSSSGFHKRIYITCCIRWRHK